MAFVLNQVTLAGRIPFDFEVKNENDDTKAFAGFNISIKKGYKKEGEKYYPEKIYYCKAFKKTAQFVGKYFKKGDNIIITGELDISDDYTDKDGKLVKGSLCILINGIGFQQGNPKSDDNSDSSKTTTSSTKSSTTTKSTLSPAKANLLTTKKKSII